MARIKSVVAAMAAVLALPGAAALTGFLIVPDAPPPNVTSVVRIGESPPPPQPGTSTSPSTPVPPPPPVDDGDDDGPDDDGDTDDG
jgi:hypothetical protein